MPRNIGMQINASKAQGWGVYTSFGINNQMIPFLDAYEQIALQQACQFCYEIAVGRVQTRVIVKKNFFLNRYDKIYQIITSGRQSKVEKVKQ